MYFNYLYFNYFTTLMTAHDDQSVVAFSTSFLWSRETESHGLVT